MEQATAWQKKCRAEKGKSFIYLGDEFYLLAGKEVPPAEWYDGFPQLENGIGLTRSFFDEWKETLAHMHDFKALLLLSFPSVRVPKSFKAF